MVFVASFQQHFQQYTQSKASGKKNKLTTYFVLFCICLTIIQTDCEEDLVKAEPALLAAQEALNTLNKNNLTELKSFGSPPGAVTNVTAAVMVLMATNGKIPKDRSWKQAKMMMAKVDAFLDALINYDKEHIHSDVIKVNFITFFFITS